MNTSTKFDIKFIEKIFYGAMFYQQSTSPRTHSKNLFNIEGHPIYETIHMWSQEEKNCNDH